MPEQSRIHDLNQDIQLKVIPKHPEVNDETRNFKDFKINIDRKPKPKHFQELHVSPIVPNPSEYDIKTSSKICPIKRDNGDQCSNSLKNKWLIGCKTLTKNSICEKKSFKWLLLSLILCILIGIYIYFYSNGFQNVVEEKGVVDRKQSDDSIKINNLEAFLVSNKSVSDASLLGSASILLPVTHQHLEQTNSKAETKNKNKISQDTFISNNTNNWENKSSYAEPEPNKSLVNNKMETFLVSNKSVSDASLLGSASILLPVTHQHLEQTNSKAETKNKNKIPQDTFISNNTNNWENKSSYSEPEPNKSLVNNKMETLNQLRFTSGHQNNFGIPIEEDERILGLLNAELLRIGRETEPSNIAIQTEESALVTPTIPPPSNELVDSSTKFNLFNEEIQCQSVSINICRGVLQYDLTSSNQNNHLSSADLKDIEHLISSNCSQRAAEFVCSVFEPECRSNQIEGLQPCRRICKSILEVCSNLILDSNILTFIFDCDKYLDSNNRSLCEDPTRRKDCNTDEFKCNDLSCIPNDWRCDNIKDCNEGEDEANCLDCSYDEFRCKSNEKCIPNENRCDKKKNCLDGSDEQDCSSEFDNIGTHLYFGPHSFWNILFRNYTTFDEDRLPSESNLDESLAVVDNVYQYSNDSIEIKGLPTTTEQDPALRNLENLQDKHIISMEDSTISNETKFRSSESEIMSSCIGDELRCVSGKCITVNQLCDKIVDCPEGEDELMCSYKEQDHKNRSIKM